MRYSASEKAEIIRLVEQSTLPVKRTLEKLGIPRATFYRWCDLYQSGGPEALGDRSPRPGRVWNRVPDVVRARIIRLALDEPTLSPRELALRFTDMENYFVSEALLKAHDLIASLQLHALAYNLGNFLRTLATPEPIKDWSLTSLKEKLIKIGAKLVSHGRYVAFQMADVAIPKNLFADILRLIAELGPPPDAAPA